jgi:hypothetical protein
MFLGFHSPLIASTLPELERLLAEEAVLQAGTFARVQVSAFGFSRCDSCQFDVVVCCV